MKDLVTLLCGWVAGQSLSRAQARPQSLHLWFLEKAPGSASLKLLETLRAASEKSALRGKVLYLHAPQGIGRSKFAARAEGLLGVAGTARNWRTVTQLLQWRAAPTRSRALFRRVRRGGVV